MRRAAHRDRARDQPLVALRVSKDGFFNLVTQFPQVGVEVMHELASRLHQTTQRLTEVLAAAARARARS